MSKKIIQLHGDHQENFYQLGLKERESFEILEKRILKLFSTIDILSQSYQIIQRSKIIFSNKNTSFFNECIESYSKGLGIKKDRYDNFILLFELAAHYGQIYPELKSILPGCTSLFQKIDNEITHTRILDFPMTSYFEKHTQIYEWNFPGMSPLIGISCEGMAPLLLQIIHSSGLSIALHHRPSSKSFNAGKSIFEILILCLAETKNLDDFKNQLKSYESSTKWGIIASDQNGKVLHLDLEGPIIDLEVFDLAHSSPLVFTNIPIKSTDLERGQFVDFCLSREKWLTEKLKRKSSSHPLDLITDISYQKESRWTHPASTLATVGAFHINLTKELLEMKMGDGALVGSDEIIQYNFKKRDPISTLKPASTLTTTERSWKKASLAQALYDQGLYDLAYHELQMAISLHPLKVWKNIFEFYLCVWDFQFIKNSTELSLVYRKLISLKLPEHFKDIYQLMTFRFEKRLDLVSTINPNDLSNEAQKLFNLEKDAPVPVFSSWMKLLYPRLDTLDVLTPYYKLN